MLNKFRYKHYDDDGCSVYECLSCKSEWNVRYIPKDYCPSCGIKFDGQLEWDEQKKYDKPKIHAAVRDELDSKYWTILERTKYDYRDVPGVWEEVHFSIDIRIPKSLERFEHHIENGRKGVADTIRFLRAVEIKMKNITVDTFGWETEYAAALVSNSWHEWQAPLEKRIFSLYPICIIKHAF